MRHLSLFSFFLFCFCFLWVFFFGGGWGGRRLGVLRICFAALKSKLQSNENSVGLINFHIGHLSIKSKREAMGQLLLKCLWSERFEKFAWRDKIKVFRSVFCPCFLIGWQMVIVHGSETYILLSFVLTLGWMSSCCVNVIQKNSSSFLSKYDIS